MTFKADFYGSDRHFRTLLMSRVCIRMDESLLSSVVVAVLMDAFDMSNGEESMDA